MPAWLLSSVQLSLSLSALIPLASFSLSFIRFFVCFCVLLAVLYGFHFIAQFSSFAERSAAAAEGFIVVVVFVIVLRLF